MKNFNLDTLFNQIYNAKDEIELQIIIDNNKELFDNANWKPLGDNKSNYGVVKNQQSSPIAVLIETTNFTDGKISRIKYEILQYMSETMELFYILPIKMIENL